jgi:hypothetical protein
MPERGCAVLIKVQPMFIGMKWVGGDTSSRELTVHGGKERRARPLPEL